MTTAERRETLQRYVKAPDVILELLATIAPEALSHRPFDDAWTIAEHVHHLLDAEANAFVRYRKAIAEPGTPVAPYDSETWTARLSYGTQGILDSLQALSLLLRIIARHLEGIIEEDWSRYRYEYPDYGPVMLDEWLALRAEHVEEHREYVRRNLRLFEERGG